MVLRKNGFKFFFFANEHLPRHIHVVKGENFAKINLETLDLSKITLTNQIQERLLKLQQNKKIFLLGVEIMFKGKKVTFDDSYLHVELQDGRVISTPMDWYPELKNSTLQQMKNYRFICRNTGVE